MNFYKKYFDTAVTLIQQYNGRVPLAIYLKHYFAQHKKHGSKDRKHITHLCYCYYRLGRALKHLPIATRLLTALFLCNNERGDWLQLYEEDWQYAYDEDLDKRIAFVQTKYAFQPEAIFFMLNNVSDAIEKTVFAKAHLIQPDLFIRIRPGFHQAVISKLDAKQISYELIGNNCIALNNTSKIDTILPLNKEAVVQDFSSQRIAEFLQSTINNHSPATVWDCCAASGGKAILAVDTLPNIQLTVSDVRASIIHNLKERFKKADIRHYHTFIADLATNFRSSKKYDLVICDAPCSGSGTWARTPEQLFFITEEKIEQYAALQKKIVSTVVKSVNKGGYLLYITCSVYKEENEAVVEFIQQTTSLQLIQSSVLKGYDVKADTMFAALFRNVAHG
ncbi:Fmu (Sun) domain-containing protein [Ilyomonas limi]|uniref:Fmu (Sun) domain-containing protein n=1 Tax=Ilyomonas limi TaxID=2575867 RepID=A0A4U3KWU4_9BACT|nr:Fmu (Sun) domain-containing protein [Ilyomonas limi]TKK65527.1 Fmu (Sun) domain-containing protein [Ilyomonas limi]